MVGQNDAYIGYIGTLCPEAILLLLIKVNGLVQMIRIIHSPRAATVTLLVLGVMVLTGAANGASIAVTNQSFESGTTGWTGLSVHDINDGLSPRPDGTLSNAWFNAVTTGYQVLGTAVQAKTTYTLTVDVGDRSSTGFPVDGTELRLGVGSTVGQNLLLLTGESRPVPTSGWQVWTATFESGPNPVAENLRIELRSGGSQPQFDNVRLDAVASSFNPKLPWNAFVRNYSFEEPNAANGQFFTPYLWSSVSGVDINGLGNHDPTPDTADGEQLMYSNGSDAYQVLDSVCLDAANTYTLTVDVGDRTDLDFGGAELRMGTGSTYGNNLLAATVVSNTTPVNGGGASDGWQTWVSTFTNGNGVVGEPLRIELVNPGGIQTLWDNVRLRVTPPKLFAGTVLIVR